VYCKFPLCALCGEVFPESDQNCGGAMKRVFLILQFALFSVPLFAGDMKVTVSNSDGIYFRYTVPRFTLKKCVVGNEEYKRIEILRMGIAGDIGDPSIPVKYIHFAVPLQTEKVRIQIRSEGRKEIKNLQIVPNFHMLWKEQELEKNPEVYGKDEYFPGKRYEIVYDKVIFHQRIMKIAIYPFQYNPSSGNLLFYKFIDVNVDFSEPNKVVGGARFLGIPTERRLGKLLINYNVSKSWREVKSKRVRSRDYIPWYKLKVTQNGIYKMDYNYFKENGIEPDYIDPRTIKVYNGGSSVLDNSVQALPGEYDTIPYQVPIYVRGESDGTFDKDDYVLFYGVSLSGWDRCSVSEDVPLYYNPFTDTNIYWLSWGEKQGKRMTVVDGNPSHNNPYKPSSFKEMVHIEENHLCPAKSGFGWVWEEIKLPLGSSSISREYSFSANNLYTDSFEIFTTVYGATTHVHNVELSMNGIPFSDTLWRDFDKTYPPFGWLSGGSMLQSGENTISLRVHNSDQDNIYVDYFEVYYYKNFKAKNNELIFCSDKNAQTDTVYEFNIYDLQESSFILDVTSPFAPRRIKNVVSTHGSMEFQILIPQDEEKTFIASASYKVPNEIVESNPYSLREVNGTDEIIITHPKFYYAATQLADWREKHFPGVVNPEIKVILVDEVFDNFGWGLVDPVAIRNFLYYASQYWDYPPGYVLLFGGGSYDYRNLYGSTEPKNYIPVYETGDYVHFQELMEKNPCYEDFFTDFTGNLLADIPIGRLTVVSKEEAGDVVDKIINYESGNLGSWRNNIILLGDDEFDWGGIDYGMHLKHIGGTESVSREVPIPFDITKVYLTEYPGIFPGNVPPGVKPKAREAFIKALNDGGLLGVFLGHGNLKQLAHENAFHRTNIGMLENDYRNPFFYFGSCSVGDFDRADEESIADLLQKSYKKGAIATLACTRTSGYNHITYLGMELAENILANRELTFGDGVLVSEQNIGFGQTYAFFGDPATPTFPDSIGFQATVGCETLIGGRRVEIYVEMDDPGLNCFLYITAFDTIKHIAHPVPTTTDTIFYKLPGDPLFKGIFNIRGENIIDTIVFFIPTYFEPLIIDSTGRISIYIWGENREGRKSIDGLITGINYDSLETIPPTIDIYHEGELLDNGMSIPSNAKLKGVLVDESGIDITGRENRAIQLAINQDYTNIKELNDYFHYNVNSSTEGSFIYTLSLDTSMTDVRLEFKCYDNCGNQGIAVYDLKVYNGEIYSMDKVFNFPNPFKKHTYFTFNLSHSSLVTLSIFTISGKMIYKKEITCDRGFNRILWNGEDADCDRVANGIYFYKIKAKSISDGSQFNNIDEVEYTGKIAVSSP
jgi:hypothetical protein